MAARQPSQRDLAVGEMMAAFRSAHGAVTSYLNGGGEMRSEGTAAIATIHLLTRGLVDVAVTQRVATERHPIQAYSVLRAAWEAARLIDLFHAEPELADEWAGGKHWIFSPAKVRTRLGDEEDNFYSYMCARSHPRFAGLQMSMFRMVGAPEGQATHFTEIPFEVPDSFMAVAAPGIVLAKLAVLAGHVNFSDKTHRRASFAPMLRAAGVELAAGWSAMGGALSEEERADPSVHDLADRAAWFREHLTTLAETIDRLYDQ
jgi:hypothetical protein